VIITLEQTLYLLRRAGYVMRLMPGGGTIVLLLSRIAMDTADDPRLAYGYNATEVSRVVPSAFDISLMDFVHRWLSYIPDEKMLLRRIVAHRMLWNPDRGQSVWSYRRLGDRFGASHQAIRRWDEVGVGLIFRSLNKTKSAESKIDLYLRGFSGAYSGYVDGGVEDRRQSSPRNYNFVNRNHEISTSRSLPNREARG
jgi:hypothetical protein